MSFKGSKLGGLPAAADVEEAHDPSWDTSTTQLNPPPAPSQPKVGLRVASYNVRVDHHEDIGTVHDWPMRRDLLTNTLLALSADVVAIQECSPAQATDLEHMLGPEWGVSVLPCNPNAWASAPDVGPSDGEMREGNGFIWRRSRMQHMDTNCFWLSPQPERPWVNEDTAWGGSVYQRTCVVGRFLDIRSGSRVGVLSTHFDTLGGESFDTGVSDARRQSAALVMDRAKQLLQSKQVEIVLLCGDMNTLLDREGTTYSALVSAADGQLVDVRDATGVSEADCGRGSSSWEGWETDGYCRAIAGDQRYDQIFVSAGVDVRRTTVVEERYPVYFADEYYWVYASDHLPITAELLIPVGKNAKLAMPAPCCGGAPKPPKTMQCLMLLGVAAGCFGLILLWLLWDMFYTSYECQMQCRNRATDPPFGCQLDAPLPPMLPPLPPFQPPSQPP